MATPPTCYPLTNTQTCTPWSSYTLQTAPGIMSNVDEFDTYITNRMDYSPSYISSVQANGCPSYNGTGAFRYHQSFLCAIAVDVSTSNGCNSQVNPPPPPMCLSSAQAYLDSLKTYWKAPTCSTTLNITEQYNRMLRNLIATQGVVEPANCIKGVGVELTQCGFQDLASAQNYCTINSQMDSCCALVNPAPNGQGSSTSGGNGSPNNTPYIIGGVLGGLAFLILVAFIVMYLRHRQSQSTAKRNIGGLSSITAGTTPPVQVSETVQVYFDYAPNLSDEISLITGDRVIVKVKFDDGWAFGYNMSSKQEGSFPMACCGPVGGIRDTVGSFRSNHNQSKHRSQISQRMSSLYIPN